MNTENLDYLKKNLLNLGFGEKVNDEMEKLIRAKVPEFNLATGQTYNNKKVDYTLHFRAGEQNDMYFFNRYEAHHKEQDRAQPFTLIRATALPPKKRSTCSKAAPSKKNFTTRKTNPTRPGSNSTSSRKMNTATTC